MNTATDKGTNPQYERWMLLRLIQDSYRRQATNRDRHYRALQMDKVNEWLERLTKLHEDHPEIWELE